MHHKGLNKIQVLVDSKLLIEWDNQHFNMENIGLIPIMNQILEVKINLLIFPFLMFIENSTSKQTTYQGSFTFVGGHLY
jgi:hypothetical protein